MGRDLLYRPHTFHVPEDEDEETGTKSVRVKSSDHVNKVQLNKELRARDLGAIGGEDILEKVINAKNKPAAFKNAYFN